MELDKYQKVGLSIQYVQKLTEPSRQLIERFVAKLDPTESTDLPPTSEIFARRTLNLAGLTVDPGFWEILQPHHGFELWSFDFEYLLGCGKFVSLTSYSQEQLLNTSWFDLFERDEIHTHQLIRAAQNAVLTNKPILNITPPHIVTEKMSQQKVSLSVTVKAIFPTYLKEDPNTPVCNIALTEFKRLT